MKKVVYIRSTKSEAIYRVGVVDTDSGESTDCTVNVRRHTELSALSVGDMLDASAEEMLLLADEEHRAYKRALSFLSYADNNERTLKRKLTMHGIRADVAEDVCREMVALGYVDDRRQLSRLIVSEAEKLYGPAKILARLVAKGYNSCDVKAVMRDLCDLGEIDFSALAKRLVDKKYPDGATVDERRAILYKHGYKG